MSSPKAHTYQKGDNKAGGGGGHGGGGKRTRPQGGWEKGDVARGITELRADARVPHKPGRDIDRAATATGPEPAPHRRPILGSLRSVNNKLLNTLRRLDNTGRSEERRALLSDVAEHLSRKRIIEADLFVLLDESYLDEMAAIQEIDRDIERDLNSLLALEPKDRAFVIGAEVLYGDVERRIGREREVLAPAWKDALRFEQASDPEANPSA
jgi:hypothetical protein